MKSKFSRRKLLLSAAASVIPAAIAQARPRVSGLFNLVAGTAGPQADEWSHAGVLDLSRTPFAKLKTVPIRSVEIQEGFWSKRRTTNIESSIPSMHDELVAHGRMDNFLRLEGKSSAAQRGPVYSDSDIYKWTEAVGFALQSGARPQLHETANAMIQEVVAAQEPGGYLNTYFDGDRKPLRMLYPTQTTGHELYCVGHMLQAAIAVYRATGDRTLLDAGIRFIDDFLLPNYGPGANQKGIVAGHPEIEMALVELYRTTGKHAYVDLAGYILHGDERIPLRPQQITYMFCGIPFTSRTHLEGHAVRAMYACCGATDYYLETGDPAYWKTLNVLWEDLDRASALRDRRRGCAGSGRSLRRSLRAAQCPRLRRKLRRNRRDDVELAHACGVRRCAFHRRDRALTLQRHQLRHVARRHALTAIAIRSRSIRRATLATATHPEGNIRNPWYDTTCCPPNLERTFASLPGLLLQHQRRRRLRPSLRQLNIQLASARWDVPFVSGRKRAIRGRATSSSTVSPAAAQRVHVCCAHPWLVADSPRSS